jgi:hypothetical protein
MWERAIAFAVVLLARAFPALAAEPAGSVLSEYDPLKLPFRLAAVVIFTLFMPLTALSFYRFRLPRKKDEFERILALLGLNKDESALWVPSIKSEYSVADYALPVLFASVLTALGAATLVFAEDLKVTNTPTLLFSALTCPTDDLQACHIRHLLVLSMAFLGAYVWSIQNLFRRLATVDLPPGAYYAVSVRIIVAAFVALLFAYSPEPLDRAVPVIAFLCGIFPDQALNYIKGKTKIFGSNSDRRADDLALDMIEGISMFHRQRLSEVGIDNAQNLAEANLVELLVRTPFKPPVLIDWMAQAKLYVVFKSDISKLREIGIRTALDLRLLGGIEGHLAKIADATKMSETRLSSAYTIVVNDPSVSRLFDAARRFAVV